ncbi:MAG: alpha-amylase, partial [Muribaculaceae bacterium]|nr:alpha-amylase [Muribaculaceae bacterium]
AYWGDNVLGAKGNDEFFHPEVVAANKFRSAMKGQKEDLQISKNGQVLLVNRGKKGAAIVNISKFANSVNLPTGLPDGKYKDLVYGKEFKVKKGILNGLLAPEKTYIIVKD